eukprot:TRINITY_DN11380_c0_g1_i1.p1 TRINITY_DN11380_c0_g1~~TRINITY_DN11380_c0_g1_i1.p1  ORF type:complete len:721 (+),score=159.73 TRINITY_DN11380_c0_g1_i1:85-2247(+)
MGFGQWLLRRAEQGGDDADTAERKRIVLHILLPAGLVAATIGVQDVLSWGKMATNTWALVVATIALLPPVARTLWTRTAPLWTIELSMVLTVFSMIIMDWYEAAAIRSFRVWSSVMIVMDCLLAIGGRRWVQNVCLHTMAAWLAVTALEDSARLGVYDMEGWSDPDPETFDAQYNCADPPCAIPPLSALSNWVFMLFCLYADYLATRGFAEGMRKEQGRMLLAVHTAERVAGCLARFDLSSAEAALSDSGPGKVGLTSDLDSSLRRLLANLAGYRPFLPHSCFALDESTRLTGSGSATARSSSSSSRRMSGGTQDAPASVVTEQLPASSVLVDQGLSSVVSIAPRNVPSSPSMARSSMGRSILSRSGSASTGSGSRPKSPPLGLGERLLMANTSTTKAPCLRIAHAVQMRRVTLLATNRRGLLEAFRQEGDVQSAEEYLGSLVTQFIQAALEQKGVVDLLSADHLHASFGAFRQPGAHRMAAARCAFLLRQPLLGTNSAASSRQASSWSIRPRDASLRSAEEAAGESALQLTAAVCSGLAMCGDFGSATAQRFMVVGGVRSLIAVVERVAAGWGAAALIDGDVVKDADMHWTCRLRGKLLCSKHSERPIAIWEMLDERLVRHHSQGEWMYQLSSTAPNPWASYNRAVELWCRGDPAAALEMISDPATELQGSPVHHRAVGEAVQALRHALSTEGPPPPVSAVPVAAGIGGGAPLRLCAAS